MKPIIEVEHVSKQYRLGARRATSGSLREAVLKGLSLPMRIARGERGPKPELFWALQDINLQVGRGEVLGLIGSNGAGKSTLLKILSQITPPTSGRVRLRGRFASLLEVGTGFHPELTGRENIFLNGALLGMSRREVRQKFDEIVAFSEIERFIDTPVKRYSSGMYVRLAFAVAAHLEPEILMVDEVLAVGDVAFQQKCLGKMQNVTQQGRTVLFVSHNIGAIKALCTRAVLLRSGHVIQTGPTQEVLHTYLSSTAATLKSGIIADDAPRRVGGTEGRIRSVHLSDLSGEETTRLYLGQPFNVRIMFEIFEQVNAAILEVSIMAADGTHVVTSFSTDGMNAPVKLRPGMHEASVNMQANLLPRSYSFIVGVHRPDGSSIDFVDGVLEFSVLPVAEDSADRYPWPEHVRGYIRPESKWQLSDPLEEELDDRMQPAGAAQS